MPNIEQTINFITKAHAGQKDKSGQPYYLHPIAVMNRLPEDVSDDVKKAALLHDIIEDTPYTRDDLKEMGYSDNCLDIVEIVTNEDGCTLSYHEKIDAIIATHNLGAILVKHADMSENNDPDRLKSLPIDVQNKFKNKYRLPLKNLSLAIEKLSVQEDKFDPQKNPQTHIRYKSTPCPGFVFHL